MTELVRGILPLLASHLELVLVALAAAFAVSLPLAIAVSRRPRAAFAIVTAAGVIQTVPGLALLALMVPVLASTGLLSPFGFPPAVTALTLYAILPIVRNAVTGLRGVDPDAIEAARGMGMTPGQLLRIVELPLAAPVIAAGVRTATVWTVGAATLATPIGQPCLGNYIFAGLQTRNFAMLLVGIAFAAALAVMLDAVLALAERALAGPHKRRVFVPASVLAAIAVLVIGVAPRLGGGSVVTRRIYASKRPAAVEHVRIGAKTFTEQYVLAALLRLQLEAVGISAEITPSLGSTVVFDALSSGSIDVYVDYSGTLWTNTLRRPAGLPRWQLLVELDGWLGDRGLRSLGPLGFENAYSLVVRRETAERLGLRTLADLAHHHDLSMGGDYEFFSRAEWAAVQRTYGLELARRTSFDPALIYDALVRGEVDVISGFSSDGRIAAFDLVELEDPAGALPPYDAMILLGASVASDPTVACALSFHVPIAAMRRANAMVDRDHAAPEAAARWLSDEIGRPGDCGPLAR